MARLPRLFWTMSPEQKKNPIAADIIVFQVIFFLVLKRYVVYSLEWPRWGNSNENTQHTFMLEKLKDFPIMPPVLALWLTHISANYACLKHIFMVPKVFEPLKFDCNWGKIRWVFGDNTCTVTSFLSSYFFVKPALCDLPSLEPSQWDGSNEGS